MFKSRNGVKNSLRNLQALKELIYFRVFDKEEMRMSRRKATGDMNWEDYQEIETIYDWIDSLQVEFPQFVNVTTIGYSSEGIPLKLLKLSKKAVSINLIIL